MNYKGLNLDNFFLKFKFKYLIFFSLISLVVGFTFIFIFNDIRFAWLHCLLLTILFSWQVFVIKQHLLSVNDFQITLAEPIIQGCFERYKRRKTNPVLYLFILLITALFSTYIIMLGYLPASPLGVYGGFLALITLVVGLFGYGQFVCILTLLCDISKRADLNTNFPPQESWFKILDRISGKLSLYFLIFGVFYVTEFSLLVPQDALKVSNAILKINTKNNLVFIVSWISVFLLITFAFPILVILRNHYFKKIIENWKNNKIQKIQLKTLDAAAKEDVDDSDKIENISKLIEIYKNTQEIIKSLSESKIVNNNFILCITTVLNILISLTTVLAQIRDLIP